MLKEPLAANDGRAARRAASRAMEILPARMSEAVKTRALAAKLMPTSGLGAAATVVERAPSEMIMTPIRIHNAQIARPKRGRVRVFTVMPPGDSWQG